jgi:hypothetical protein
MNIRILNRVNAWKVAGKRGIVRKMKAIMGRGVKDRGVEINVKINEIKKIEGNLMENSGVKN